MRLRTFVSLAIIVATLVAGCQHTPRPNAAEPAAKQSRQPGYLPEQRYATSSIHEEWTLAGEPVDVTLVRPSGRDLFPLVIYLPGLGESSSGGAAWRNAWAQAGYAVLSLQATANGETIWSSERARRAEFHDLAREQFAAAGLAKRLAVLRDVFEELNRRQTRGALAGVDISRIAFAGFDLGAQTVMAAAGETGYGIEWLALPTAVKCVIVLSPYADFAGPGFGQRFASIQVPVLSVTSFDDTDPNGLVTTAVRRAPFEYMPPGQKYLLSLVSAPHALIAGKEAPGADGNVPTRDDGSRSASSGGANPGSGTGRRRGNNGGSGQGRRGGDTASGDAMTSSLRPVSTAAWVAHLGQVQSVTAAYLDMNLKNDAVATEWLTKDARRWLGDEADLIVK